MKLPETARRLKSNSMLYIWKNKSVENEICYFYPCQKPQNIRHEADWKEVRVFALLGSRCLTAADFRTSSQFARGQHFYEVAFEFLIPLRFHKIFSDPLFCIKKLKNWASHSISRNTDSKYFITNKNDSIIKIFFLALFYSSKQSDLI